MVQKLLKSMVSASQDALLGNNPVLAFKTMQRLEAAIDMLEDDEPASTVSAPARPGAAPAPSTPEEAGVYKELIEREPPSGKKKVEPSIQIVEHETLPGHAKLLKDVDVKAAKIGLNDGLAEKEEPEQSLEDAAAEEVLSNDDEREPGVSETGERPPEIIVVEDERKPELQVLAESTEHRGPQTAQPEEEVREDDGEKTTE